LITLLKREAGNPRICFQQTSTSSRTRMESERPKKKLRVEVASDEREEILRLRKRVGELENLLEERKKETIEESRIMEALNKFEEEKRMLKEEVDKIEERTAEKFRKLVECPVCLSTPREGPVPCCPSGHLVCVTCLNKWKGEGRADCPTCRHAMGQGKSLLAFAVAEKVHHECTHQDCTTMLPLGQIEEHERGCDWRLIFCPSWPSCRARIPFCQVESHAQVCDRCEWSPLKISKEGVTLRLNYEVPKWFLDKNNKTLEMGETPVLPFKGFLFFVRVSKMGDGGNFVIDVAMNGGLEDCQGFMIEASMIDVKSGEDKVAFKATFKPRSLQKVDKDGFFCLSVPHEVLTGLLGYNAESDGYLLSFHVKIVKLA